MTNFKFHSECLSFRVYREEMPYILIHGSVLSDIHYDDFLKTGFAVSTKDLVRICLN